MSASSYKTSNKVHSIPSLPPIHIQHVFLLTPCNPVT
nr:MAG TPA: hypothetical protein [Caudoviricetes sp.]